MNKKVLIVIAIIVLVGSFSLGAAIPSVFDIGLNNTYSVLSFMAVEEGGLAQYTPGIRITGYPCKWFGISADVAVFAPFAESLESGDFLLEVGADGVFRYPFGLVEPYLAIGPAYRMTVGKDKFVFEEEVLLSVRVGLDFNILPMLGIGVEARHFLDIPTLIAGPEENALFEIMALYNTRVGITIKAKF
jgi:hypothetical protein